MENITRINEPYPAVAIDNFIPSPSLVRAAGESFKSVKPEGWVNYSKESGQIQYASRDRIYSFSCFDGIRPYCDIF